MAKQQWNLKSFSNHIDPEKEEQLRRLKLGVDDQVEKILKITRDINHGNKERNLRKKSEAIELIQDFHMQYEKLYILYENLREKVKKSVDGGDDSYSPARDLDSESNYSVKEMNGANDDCETSDLEDTLTCSSVVTKIMNSGPGSPFCRSPGLGDIVRDIEMNREKAGKTSHMLAEIKYLEAQLDAMKVEVSTLNKDKRRLEEEVEWKSNEAVQAQEKISGLEAQIMEMEAAKNEQERIFSSLSKQYVGEKQQYASQISEFEAQAQGMQLEINSLKHEKDELEGRLLDETKKVEDFMDQVSSLQKELETVNGKEAELKLQLQKKSEEISERFLQMEDLRNELSLSEQQTAEDKERLTLKLHDLESEMDFFSSTKSELEEQIYKMNHEASESNLEKEKLQEKVSELQRAIEHKENVLSTEQSKFNDCQAMMSLKMKSFEEAVESLKNELETLGNETNNLQNEKKLLQAELEKEKEQFSLSKSHLEKVAKTSFLNVERKIEEMAAELRKQFEDQYRLLSRRIRVAEQLQAENKEWYRKTRDAYEQANKDLMEMTAKAETDLKTVMDLSLAANDLLTSIDLNAFKFEECIADIQSRISKASCEINFAKQWAMSKNKALLDMKDDLDCLVAQLDDKEAEILASTEKVWMLENKVRDLEKIIEEKGDEMLVLTEEKKEAIRQLCVWIDYHRARSDSYKKLLSEMKTHR